MTRADRRSRRGRLVGSVAAALLLVVGVTSFVLPILLASCILAPLTVYLGDRYDRRASERAART